MQAISEVNMFPLFKKKEKRKKEKETPKQYHLFIRLW